MHVKLMKFFSKDTSGGKSKKKQYFAFTMATISIPNKWIENFLSNRANKTSERTIILLFNKPSSFCCDECKTLIDMQNMLTCGNFYTKEVECKYSRLEKCKILWWRNDFLYILRRNLTPANSKR